MNLLLLSLSCLLASAQETPQDQLDQAKELLKSRHTEEAVALAHKAADQGLPEAWYWLGMNTVGDTTPYFEKAAEQGYAKAFPYLLDQLLFRAGNAADTDKAKKFGDLARKAGMKADYATIDRCYAAGSPDLPAADRVGPSDTDADCSVLKDAQDWTKYRLCLLSQDEPDNNALAELYANGWGVAKDARLATALVCHGSEVPAELEGMVETLAAEKDASTPFLFCDHVTSGMNGGLCSAEAEKTAGRKRQALLDSLSSGWSEEQKAALAELLKTADAFFTEHAGAEQDMSGTARASIAVDEEARLRDGLAASLKACEKGDLPAPGDFAKSDAELNSLYSALMARAKVQEYGTVSKGGVRSAQRKWLAYRDAWAAFGTSRYPKTGAEAWKDRTTRERVKQFKELAGEGR